MHDVLCAVVCNPLSGAALWLSCAMHTLVDFDRYPRTPQLFPSIRGVRPDLSSCQTVLHDFRLHNIDLAVEHENSFGRRLIMRCFRLGDLVKAHKMSLYPMIVKSIRSGALIREVCEALLEMECKEFAQSAVPAVLPQLIVEHSDHILEEVSLFIFFFRF